MTIRKDQKYHVRSRVQRAFLLWFKEARKRLKVPFRISVRRKQYLCLKSTSDPNVTITVLLSAAGLFVGIAWQGGNEQDLQLNCVKPERTCTGYICSMHSDPVEWGSEVVIHEERKIYKTREDVWRVHLFEVFLDYVNDTLTKFPWIELIDESYARKGDGWIVNETAFCVLPRNSTEDRYVGQGTKSRHLPNPLYLP